MSPNHRSSRVTLPIGALFIIRACWVFKYERRIDLEERDALAKRTRVSCLLAYCSQPFTTDFSCLSCSGGYFGPVTLEHVSASKLRGELHSRHRTGILLQLI